MEVLTCPTWHDWTLPGRFSLCCWQCCCICILPAVSSNFIILGAWLTVRWLARIGSLNLTSHYNLGSLKQFWSRHDSMFELSVGTHKQVIYVTNWLKLGFLLLTRSPLCCFLVSVASWAESDVHGSDVVFAVSGSFWIHHPITSLICLGVCVGLVLTSWKPGACVSVWRCTPCNKNSLFNRHWMVTYCLVPCRNILVM